MKYSIGWKKLVDEHDPSFVPETEESRKVDNYITLVCVILLGWILLGDFEMMQPLFDLIKGLQEAVAKVADNQLEIITRLKHAENDILAIRASIKQSMADEAKMNIRAGWYTKAGDWDE